MVQREGAETLSGRASASDPTVTLRPLRAPSRLNGSSEFWLTGEDRIDLDLAKLSKSINDSQCVSRPFSAPSQAMLIPTAWAYLDFGKL